MNVIGTIRQIESDYDDAYLNIADMGAGGVGVWRGLHQPTYLLQCGSTIYFATFASVAWATEWFDEHDQYDVLWKWEPTE